MNLWQMLMARRGLMDAAEAHERGGAGGGAPAGDNEQGNQDPGKQGEQKEQPKGDDDEYAGMTQEELLAELRKSKKAGADLLKENMKRKEKERTLADQLAQYGDIDPARARQLLEAEQAAETARREAEQAELERRGEFDAVKKQMIEAHQAQLVEMTVGASFSGSAFLRDKVLMTPAKARVIYGSHFEVGEDGSVVGFDKPAGQKERAVLVDGEGKPLPFESAIERILRADPEADALLRSEAKQGAGSNSKPTHKVNQPKSKSTMDKLTSGLGKIGLK
ncbi:DUF6651 domain-containing protein [Yersinia pestis]|uniref:Uncharacterized protein n=9 Tax=Yersinia pestis TaxID=632 RepID=Q9RIE0_YERPE|nr:DUF6651 domain-containing protein [Yersinia pestis]EDR31252.1 conserved hypothetical protein [Yersinia pestis biovar Orientalis str. IP275]ABG16159.1 hypothetical protein YPA_MT0023 [Yersinia pestis Antiqua]ABR14924.1 hypothetical protein YPMT1.22c [Yersinia pestis CA88-4125]ACY60626.1 hypothetical protein YPD4_pMT0021 [Yersinia pestis D106004]ACY64399.1 hypothetical protein YPD8_pMT0021 [Yersinia pestis D182038]